MLSCRGANGKQAQTGKERDLVMIVMEKKGDGLEAVVWSEAPTIYMDTWAVDGVAHHREQHAKNSKVP